MNGTEILIVEDEVKIARLLEDYLTHDGFRVSRLDEGGEGIEPGLGAARQPAFRSACPSCRAVRRCPIISSTG